MQEFKLIINQGKKILWAINFQDFVGLFYPQKLLSVNFTNQCNLFQIYYHEY